MDVKCPKCGYSFYGIEGLVECPICKYHFSTPVAYTPVYPLLKKKSGKLSQGMSLHE